MKKEKLTFAHIERIKNRKDIELNGETYSSSSFYNVKEHSFDESFFEKNGIECCRYADNKNATEDKKLYTLTQLTKEFELYPKSKAPVRAYMYTKKYGCYPLFLKKDCYSIAKSDEEKERLKLIKEKRKTTARINRTCEFCSGVERKKIKNHIEGKRVCYDCLDKIEEEKAFQESKIHNFRIKGISYEESRIELALKIQSEVENNRKIKLSLEREPTNEHDQNAIKIMCFNEQLGYVDARVASKVAPLIDGSKDISIEFDYDDFEIYNYDYYHIWDNDDSIEVVTVYRLNAILKIK